MRESFALPHPDYPKRPAVEPIDDLFEVQYEETKAILDLATAEVDRLCAIIEADSHPQGLRR